MYSITKNMQHIIYLPTKKQYVVKVDVNGKKFIRPGKKVYLCDIRGKYRYMCTYIKKQMTAGSSEEWFTSRPSMQMNVDGDRSVLEDLSLGYTVNGHRVPVFRKYFGSIENNPEYDIVKLIYSEQQNGRYLDLIRIFFVNKEYYDAELLDVYNETHASTPHLKQGEIQTYLNRLHDLHVIYIDLKDDNMGYSHITNTWKLYDFDVSGIANPDGLTWKVEPPFYYNYKYAYQQEFDIPLNVYKIEKKPGKDVQPLTKIDDIMFERWVSGRSY
jgi:serine/threonine protein kinase